MKYRKIIILILAIFPFISGFSYYLTVKGRAPSEFMSGFVSPFKTESLQQYRETLITSYDPEISWEPGEEFGAAIQPEIFGEAGILVELNSGKVLFEKNSTKKMKIASLTKIMTAVIAFEHGDLDQKVYISKKVASVGENSMGLTEGEVYTLEELLYGLMLPSGNDAAYAISEGIAGDTGRFVEWMNFKAKELGMNSTSFACPSGLDDNTYSSSTDTLRLTRYAMKHPKFREIVRTVEIELIGEGHKYVPLYNQTNLLTTYPGVAGVKTGYTGEAGLTLVTYAENSGYEVIGVVLKSIDRKGDMILMLDHGFGTLGVPVEHDLL